VRYPKLCLLVQQAAPRRHLTTAARIVVSSVWLSDENSSSRTNVLPLRCRVEPLPGKQYAGLPAVFDTFALVARRTLSL
jgi:hypothetical protein